MKLPSGEEIKLWGKWRVIWANTKNLSMCHDLINEGKVDAIGLSPYSGSNIYNLNPFNEWMKLKGMVLPYAADMDLSDLDRMNFLQFLVVGGTSRPIDLSGYSSLADLSIDWHKKLRLPASDNALRDLRIDGFSPGSRNLTEISRFAGLSKIEFVKGNLETLQGCAELGSLAEVELHYLSKLRDVKCLSKTPVAKICITNCKKIENLDSLADCQNLEVIHYHDSAPLKSIDFIRRCKALKEFRFVNVDVLDGDMTPLLGLQKFAFTKKKNFSHSEEMIQKMQ